MIMCKQLVKLKKKIVKLKNGCLKD